MGGQVVDVIMCIRMLVTHTLRWPIGRLFICKTDIHKAFDSVFHSTIIEILEDCAVPNLLIYNFMKTVVSGKLQHKFCKQNM